MSRGTQFIVFALWVLGLGAGFAVLARHQFTPGAPALEISAWPSHTQVQRAQGAAHMVLFAHPKCPCTRSSLTQLEHLAQANADLVVDVVFVATPLAEAQSTDAWARAASMPGVRVQADVDATEAERFGAMTSGEAMLFDASGRLRVGGGLTASRGHEGTGAAVAAMTAVLHGEDAPVLSHFPVFGCSLRRGSQLSRR